ncbi:MAG: hypothetical protein CENE_00467 [Candidatus Celerinatantimonas neptuna]|nr:MAG: hypothetical protein CENE_00467 [Candidatus Celerinatantimonas neptuna]
MVESHICYVPNVKEPDGHFVAWKGLKSLVMVENFRVVKVKLPELEYVASRINPDQRANETEILHGESQLFLD